MPATSAPVAIPVGTSLGYCDLNTMRDSTIRNVKGISNHDSRGY